MAHKHEYKDMKKSTKIRSINIEPLDDGTFLMRYHFENEGKENFITGNDKTYSFPNIASLLSDLRKDFKIEKPYEKDELKKELSNSAHKDKKEE